MDQLRLGRSLALDPPHPHLRREKGPELPLRAFPSIQGELSTQAFLFGQIMLAPIETPSTSTITESD
ncbi:MAG: hypothetical protein RL318_821 [Fibrobacterota bacterium]|jgi:hypothetical protein